MHYYIISGELSGDLYGAKLIEHLKQKDSNAQFTCWGGENIEKHGVDMVQRLDKLSFLGFWEVLKNAKNIINNFTLVKRSIKSCNPDAIILIDYPGFNLRAAKFAANLNIPVFWFVAPQLWAWKEGRIKYLQKYVDKLFVLFPFELDFFKKYNVNTYYFGHPLTDVIPDVLEHKKVSSRPVIVLMPGSRKQEIKNLLPTMLFAAKKFTDYRFVVLCAQGINTALYEDLVYGHDVELFFDKKILESASCALVASGTASLELAFFKIPQIVCYKLNWISYWIARCFTKIKYISIVNILAEKMVVKELIQNDFNVTNIQHELACILDDKNRKKIIGEYNKIVNNLGSPGSFQKISNMIYSDLAGMINNAAKR